MLLDQGGEELNGMLDELLHAKYGAFYLEDTKEEKEKLRAHLLGEINTYLFDVIAQDLTPELAQEIERLATAGDGEGATELLKKNVPNVETLIQEAIGMFVTTYIG